MCVTLKNERKKHRVDENNAANNNKARGDECDVCVACDKSKTARAPINEDGSNTQRDVQPFRSVLTVM